MRRKSKNIRIVLIAIFSITLLFFSMSYAILKQEIKITGKATLVTNETSLQNFVVNAKIAEKWYSDGLYYFKINFNLKNNSKKDSNGWKVEFVAPEEAQIINFANTDCKIVNEKVVLKNVSYNAVIAPKASVDFEIIISTTNSKFKPNNFIVNESPVLPEENEPSQKPDEILLKAEVNLVKDTEWNNEETYFYQYTATVKNVGEEISSWNFKIDFGNNANINQIWNGSFEKENETTYIFNNSNYNGIIPVNGQVSFGFIVETKKLENELTAIDINLK